MTDRERLLDRLRREIALLDLKVLAVEIEFVVLGPQPLDDLEPFDRELVADFMIEQRRAEHFDFGAVPAGDDVERKPPAGDVIDRGRLLGHHDRMDR